VVKKRKSVRPVKKASSTARKKTRKAAPRKAMAKQIPTGLENENEVDFRPLKSLMKAHITRLSAAKPSDRVLNALRSLQRAQSDLSNECLPTMVIPTS
jgi:hypothetical protein